MHKRPEAQKYKTPYHHTMQQLILKKKINKSTFSVAATHHKVCNGKNIVLYEKSTVKVERVTQRFIVSWLLLCWTPDRAARDFSLLIRCYSFSAP